MGQRLNVEIKKGDKVLANAYYHLGGFTSSAMRICYDAINAIKYLKKDKSANDLTRAVRALITTGATLTESEWEALSHMDTGGRIFVKPTSADKNDGLISVSEKGIEETQYWKEQRFIIDIETETFDAEDIFFITDKEEYEQDYGKETTEYPTKLVELNGIAFDDFGKFLAGVSEDHTWVYDNEIIRWVE